MIRFCLTLTGFACVLSAFAKIEMGTPFSDGVILQRDADVPVWGCASPGCRVSVSFADAEISTVADADGEWVARLPRMSASKEGRILRVEERELGWFGSVTDVLEIGDVLVGEVWFASGQSNMECPIVGLHPHFRDGDGALVSMMTDLPYVRFAKNVKQWSVKPTRAESSGWRRLERKSFSDCELSAVAYYYARELYFALDIPIGIVDSSWHGTNIDAWTPRCGYEDCDPSIRATAEYRVKEDWNEAADKQAPIVGAHQQPTVLFNAMVDSWAPMAMRGMIWYQGCSNGGEAQRYCAKMHALYKGWSRRFDNANLKLYFVQLAPFKSNWNDLVAAQNRFVAEEPNAAIAVTADVGNFCDVHPNRKEIVSRRLAVHALKRDYGRDIPEDCSPVFKSATFSGNSVCLTFDHVQKWYVYDPAFSLEPPFEIRDVDGKWVAAKLQNVDWRGNVKGEQLVVKAAEGVVASAVRYMGRPKTMGILYNQVALPLGPFSAERQKDCK